MARKKAPKAKDSSCDRLARSVAGFGSIMADLGDVESTLPVNGFSILGPNDRYIFYKVRCARKGKFGPGMCSSYEITREGDVPAGLKKKDYVGNLHGLSRQVSRDFARMWDSRCTLSPTPGFQGAKRRKKRR
jgi:hypothetical protein